MPSWRNQRPQVTFAPQAGRRIINARIPFNHRKGRIPINKVKYLVERLFHGCAKIFLYPFPDAEEGFSGALLLRVEGKTAKGYSILPCILKVGSQRRIKQEFKNFRDFVDLVIGNAPQLYRDGYKNIKDWAGIAYTKIGGRWEEVKTFKGLYSEAASEEDRERLRLQLGRLFDLISPWQEVRPEHYSIWRVYHVEEERLKQMGNARAELARKGYELGRLDPIEYWQEVSRHGGEDSPGEVGFATIHGDLNSRNIVINTSEDKPYVIDFSETGQGHYLRDLAKLEADIKFVLMDQRREGETDRLSLWLYMDAALDSGPFGKLERHAVEMQMTDEEILKAYHLIRFVRSLARKRMESVGPIGQQVVEYRVALLHYTLKKLVFNIREPKLVFASKSASRLCHFKLGTRAGRILEEHEKPEMLLFLWTHGTNEWREGLDASNLRRYVCICGCFCRADLEISADGENFYIIAAVIDKLILSTRERWGRGEKLMRIGLEAVLESFAEYLLLKNKRGKVIGGWKGKHEQGTLEKVFRQIYEDGTELRHASLFRETLSRSIGIQKYEKSPGVGVARELAAETMRDILVCRGVDPPKQRLSGAIGEKYWGKFLLPLQD